MAFKVCIIEDDEGIQDVLRIILKRAGFESDIFPDGGAVMTNKYSRPDLFLIDKQLPGTDGLAICRYLKEGGATHDIPIIMMSAYPNVKELSNVNGADDFIEKPFKIETLLATIRRHMSAADEAPVPVSATSSKVKNTALRH